MKIIVKHTFFDIRAALRLVNYKIIHVRTGISTQIRGVRQYGDDIYLTPVDGELILISPEDEISYIINE
jgi:hypothetical protein